MEDDWVAEHKPGFLYAGSEHPVSAFHADMASEAQMDPAAMMSPFVDARTERVNTKRRQQATELELVREADAVCLL